MIEGMMPLRPTAATRRQKRWGAAMPVLLLAAFLAALGSARAGDFVDSAGRRVLLPEPIERVMPANPTAEVLVYVLAPERLVGASRRARRGAAASRHVPVLGWRPGMGPASMAETATRLRAQMIIDAGPVTPERAAFADQVQQLAGIPYILVDDSFVRMPSMLRGIGALLGVTEHARHLGRYAEDTINTMRGRLLIQAPETRPHVYYGRRADGLETPLPGAPEADSIEQAGAINVARVLGRDGLAAITPTQLYEWNPEIIIAEERSFYNALRRDRAWRGLAAVAHKRVYLAPAYPFGWIDDPPGVNRLIGLHWLSGLFYPDANQDDLRAAVCEFYDQFYRIKLTNAQVEAMVRPAGAPPVEAPHGAPEPLVGLGAMPPSPLPSTTPATPLEPSATVSPMSPVTPSAPEATAPSTTPAPEATAPSTTPAPSATGLPEPPPAPSTASATCTLPGANGPLGNNSPSAALPGIGPPGRRGAAPGLGLPRAGPQ